MPADSAHRYMPTHGVQAQILEGCNFRHAAKVFDPKRKISEGEFDTILETAHQILSEDGGESAIHVRTNGKSEVVPAN